LLSQIPFYISLDYFNLQIVITKIETQKKKKDRYSLFAGEKFLIGVSQHTLIKFGLHTGKKLNPSDLDTIRETEAERQMHDQAYRFLSRRAHSCKELSDKLTNKGYAQSQIQQLIESMVSDGYLNDEEFARVFISEEIKLKRSGPLLIRSKLTKKGVAREVIDSLLPYLYNEDEQIDNCSVLIARKYKHINSKQKQSAINYLRNKGYHWEQISMAIPRFIMESDDEE
jgi:regulatory protein